MEYSAITRFIEPIVSELIDSPEQITTDKFVVVYPGRFQPFHSGHFHTYMYLVKKYGKNNVYILTSDKTDVDKSPLSFKEKSLIMTKMFGIPKSKIINDPVPMFPNKFMTKLGKDETAVVMGVGSKDSKRYSNPKFSSKAPSPNKLKNLKPYSSHIYVDYVDIPSSMMPASKIRELFRTSNDKVSLFKKIYGKYDKQIFDLIDSKIATLNESLKEAAIEFVNSNKFTELITELSNTSFAGGRSSVDDGPSYHWATVNSYTRFSKKRAEQIGWTIIDYLVNGADVNYTLYPNYPDGPVKAVSFLPAGVAGKKTATNQIEYIKAKGWDAWYKHMTRVAGLAGYEVLRTKDELLRNAKLRQQVSVQSTADSKSSNNDYHLNESVKAIDDSDILFNTGISVEDEQVIKSFCLFASKCLELESIPKTIITDDRSKIETTGVYDIELKEVQVYAKGRALADILRSIVHEYVHHLQNVENRIQGVERIELENEAHAKAGEIVTKFKEVVNTDIYVNEAITIPVEVGDTILTGKFKNKKMVVKSITTDEHGMPVINGRKVVTFRLVKDDVSEISRSELDSVEKFADNKLRPDDIEFTRHFFDRLNDPRNGEPITKNELISFFDKLSNHKDKFNSFLSKYHEIVATDKSHRLNIPFVKDANFAIAKTIMRKKDFRTSNPKLYFEFKTGTSLKEDDSEFTHIGWGRYKKQGDVNNPSSPTFEKDSSGNYVEMGGDGSDNNKDWKSGKDGWEVLDDVRAEVKNIRDYSKDEYENETGEYFENDTTMKVAPKAFKSKSDMIAKMKKARPVYFSSEELQNMNNSDVGDILQASEDGGIEGMISLGKNLSKKYGKDWARLEQGIKSNSPVPPPIALRDSNGELHLLAGNTRLMSYTAHGKKLPVKIIDYDGEFQYGSENDRLSEKYIKRLAIDAIKPLLKEGGGYGHMAHPFDDMDLTFGDLKQIINLSLSGEITVVGEKTDGQNLMASWKNGKMIFARNKSHMKNKGANALDLKGIQTLFSGRGDIEEAFTLAADNIQSAVSKLPSKQRESVFNEGANWVSLEVIYPKTANVIPYGHSLLIFHTVLIYDDNAVAIGEVPNSSKLLADMIKDANADVQDTFSIKGQFIPKIKKSRQFDKSKQKYYSKLRKLQSQFKLKDSDKISLYHQRWWEDYVDNQVMLPEKERMGLVKRWAFGDKSFRINHISNLKVRAWADKVDKQDYKTQMYKNIQPFELIFLELGTEILQNFSDLIAANPEQAAIDLRKRTEQSIKKMKSSKDLKDVEFVNKQLERLNAIGGLDAIVPSEGLVFNYKGNIYKLTGTFAPVNQILGYFKFKR